MNQCNNNRDHSKLKILAVSHYCPFPIRSGGNQRSFRVLRELSSAAEVRIALPVAESSRIRAFKSLLGVPIYNIRDVNVKRVVSSPEQK